MSKYITWIEKKKNLLRKALISILFYVRIIVKCVFIFGKNNSNDR
jgi:hypothetical protein